MEVKEVYGLKETLTGLTVWVGVGVVVGDGRKQTFRLLFCSIDGAIEYFSYIYFLSDITFILEG